MGVIKVVESPDAPKPIGHYSQAMIDGNYLFCSGQIGLDPKTGEISGKDAAEQAERAILNLEAVLRAAGLALSDVIKVSLYLRNMEDFQRVNEVYARHFGLSKPARSAVGVSSLPRNALVEIEAIARSR